MNDGIAVAFLQMNGQNLVDILTKSSSERREELKILLRAAFGDLKEISTTGMALATLMEYLAILQEINAIFSSIDTTSTYELARICCKSLKFSEYRNEFSFKLHTYFKHKYATSKTYY